MYEAEVFAMEVQAVNGLVELSQRSIKPAWPDKLSTELVDPAQTASALLAVTAPPTEDGSTVMVAAAKVEGQLRLLVVQVTI